MAAQNHQNVCRYNKFGYCKHKDMCRNQHINEICENSLCDIISCNLRHPRKCKYYMEYNRCKFSPCAYLHVEKNEVRNNEVNEKFENIFKILKEKDDVIEKLVERVKILEERNNLNDVLEEFPDKPPALVVAEVELEETLKCDICDFETKNEKGLKIHKRRKHGPKFKCESCENEFDSKRDLKTHKLSHSVTTNRKNTVLENQTCQKCNYNCGSIESMEVHLGKGCLGNFECGLCEAKFKNLESLETHLHTCEMYECCVCFKRLKTLSKIKTHIKDEHEDCQMVIHLKMDRWNENEVSRKSYHI